MKVSTIYNGTLITGVVLERSPQFLEVAITSPFTKLSTSRRLSAQLDTSRTAVDKMLEVECTSLLVELYEVASSALNY